MDTDKRKELEVLAKPLNEWLQRNFTPYHRIIINSDSAVVTQDEIGVPFDVFD